jgi:AraC family transcriptional activator of pyochelin receptor
MKEQWLVHILAALNQSKTGKLPRHALSHADRLRMFEVEEYLLAHLSHPPSLSLLASKMNTHEKKLNQQFKQVFGMTIFVWLREQRLQTALQLLEQGEKSIQQVAQYCGYKYQADFSKAFKQRFKLTPTAITRGH